MGPRVLSNAGELSNVHGMEKLSEPNQELVRKAFAEKEASRRSGASSARVSLIRLGFPLGQGTELQTCAASQRPEATRAILATHAAVLHCLSATPPCVPPFHVAQASGEKPKRKRSKPKREEEMDSEDDEEDDEDLNGE